MNALLTPPPVKKHAPDDPFLLSDSGKGWELVDGELRELNVSFQSSFTAGEVYFHLRSHVGSHGLGWVSPEGTSYRCFPDDPKLVRRDDFHHQIGNDRAMPFALRLFLRDSSECVKGSIRSANEFGIVREAAIGSALGRDPSEVLRLHVIRQLRTHPTGGETGLEAHVQLPQFPIDQFPSLAVIRKEKRLVRCVLLDRRRREQCIHRESPEVAC